MTAVEGTYHGQPGHVDHRTPRRCADGGRDETTGLKKKHLCVGLCFVEKPAWDRVWYVADLC